MSRSSSPSGGATRKKQGAKSAKPRAQTFAGAKPQKPKAPRKGKPGRPRLSDAEKNRRGTLQRCRMVPPPVRKVTRTSVSPAPARPFTAIAHGYVADVIDGRIV